MSLVETTRRLDDDEFARFSPLFAVHPKHISVRELALLLVVFVIGVAAVVGGVWLYLSFPRGWGGIGLLALVVLGIGLAGVATGGIGSIVLDAIRSKDFPDLDREDLWQVRDFSALGAWTVPFDDEHGDLAILLLEPDKYFVLLACWLASADQGPSPSRISWSGREHTIKKRGIGRIEPTSTPQPVTALSHPAEASSPQDVNGAKLSADWRNTTEPDILVAQFRTRDQMPRELMALIDAARSQR